MVTNALAAGFDVVAVLVVFLLALLVGIDAVMQLHERYGRAPRARRAAVLANLQRGLDDEARCALEYTFRP